MPPLPLPPPVPYVLYIILLLYYCYYCPPRCVYRAYFPWAVTPFSPPLLLPTASLRLRSIASLVPESWSGAPESRRHKMFAHGVKVVNFVDSIRYLEFVVNVISRHQPIDHHNTNSSQLGSILRRNPLARLLLILYMVIYIYI